MHQFRKLNNVFRRTSCVENIRLRLSSNVYISRRFAVTEDSWVAQRLKQQGEKIEQGADKLTIVDDAYINKPSEKVLKLVQEICELNIIECNQMNTLLMVLHYHTFIPKIINFSVVF